MLLKKINSRLLGIKTGYLNNNTVVARVIKNLSEQNRLHGSTAKTQIFSLKPVVSLDHLLFAAEQALSSIDSGTAFSDRQEIELLLRLSAQKQIDKAVSLFGINGKKREPACIVSIAETKQHAFSAVEKTMEIIPLKEDTKAIEKESKKHIAFKKSAFAISEKELKALADLKAKALESAVLERIALLSLET